jgi:hypothetical protein
MSDTPESASASASEPKAFGLPANLQNLPLPPGSAEMAERLGLRYPEYKVCRGTITTAEQARDLIGMIVTTPYEGGYRYVDRDTGEYWEVGAELAAKFRESNAQAQARWDAMSPEEIDELKRSHYEFSRPEVMERNMRESREVIARAKRETDPEKARAILDEYSREYRARMGYGDCQAECST